MKKAMASGIGGPARTAALVVVALVLLSLSGCGSSDATGSHSYVYEGEDSVRYIEWESGDRSASGQWEGVIYEPEEDDGKDEYGDSISGQVNEEEILIYPDEEELDYEGEVDGGEFVLNWEGDDGPESLTYTEGSREDYEAALEEFDNGLQARLEVDREMADAESIVGETLSGPQLYDNIGENLEDLESLNEEIESLPEINEEEMEANRESAGRMGDFNDPEICTLPPEPAGEPTYLDTLTPVDSGEFAEDFSVPEYKEQLEDKRQTLADAEEALSDSNADTDQQYQRLEQLRSRVEEDASKVEEIEDLAQQTNEEFEKVKATNEGYIDDYNQLYNETCFE